MNYSEEFKKYATKHHGVNSMYYDKIISDKSKKIKDEGNFGFIFIELEKK